MKLFDKEIEINSFS